MNSEAGEKTEEATDKRIRDARREGTVAKSMEVQSALLMIGLVLLVPAMAPTLLTGVLLSMRTGLQLADYQPDLATIGRQTAFVLVPVLPFLLAILALSMGIGLFAGFGQVGFQLSGQALSPNLQKINPIAGLKRMFSAIALFEGFKALVKTVAFGWIAYSAFWEAFPQLANLAQTPLPSSIAIVGGILGSIASRIAMLWLVLALLDYLFQRKSVAKQLRMSKQEVRREMKEAEASPELRSRRLIQARKLSKGRMSEAVKTANVVITNPTHYAVALRYQSGKDYAPVVVAKGQEFLAARIREIAKENRVPLVSNPMLARALYRKCEVGDFVPRELFHAVAEVLAYVYKALNDVRR